MYYGIDSDTATFPTGAKSKDFYAGRRGTGTTANSDYWNTAGANLAKKRYMYWGLKGPVSDPNFTAGRYTGDQGYAWGQKQGSAARTERANSPANMNTIFGDIESGFGGWFGANDTVNGNLEKGADVNYRVFQGFCDSVSSSVYKSGVYTSAGDWSAIMGSKSPSYSSVLWGANWPGLTFNSPPADFSKCKAINGITPTMWQYYGVTGTHDATKTGDANVATSLPS
ncbi:hypothetical protein [Paenibacillus sp. HW567]|uniref:hypothetical protein n=1 Tax=Paenibacillus sp. HW567 TaxID=1034769 RepID=UPI0003789345|nr:hypothetical protein [Paenibacillus sp. HW567]